MSDYGTVAQVASDAMPAEPSAAAAPSTNSTPPAPPQEPAAAAAASGGAQIDAKQVKQLRDMTGAGMMDCKKALVESAGDMQAAQEWLRKKGISQAEKKAGRIAAEGAVAAYVHGGGAIGVMVEVNCETDFVAQSDQFQQFAKDVALQLAATEGLEVVNAADVSDEMLAKEREVELGKEDLQNKPDDIKVKIVEGRLGKLRDQRALMSQEFIKSDGETVEEVRKKLVADIGENVTVRRFVRYDMGAGLEKKQDDLAAEVEKQTEALKSQAAEKAPSQDPAVAAAPAELPAVQVDAATVKKLREQVGAGMMDCKKALAASNNDLDAASTYLAKKGLASAGKKAGRVAAQGVVQDYVHAGGAIGVLLELNCETDFVAKSDAFTQLATDLAMQVAADDSVEFVSIDEIGEELRQKELEIEMQKEDLQSKPENIRPKIAEGRVKKNLDSKCLLSQDHIKFDNKTVEEVVKETIAQVGENIRVRRFTRYDLGAGIEKKSEDFAAEVAAQIA